MCSSMMYQQLEIYPSCVQHSVVENAPGGERGWGEGGREGGMEQYS